MAVLLASVPGGPHDFQLPKPLHGWREFAGEIAVIVIGVLIALAAEEFVQRLNWREQVREAQEALNAQLAESQYAALERVAIGECTNRQIDRLDELLEGNVFPKVDLSRLGAIRLWGTASWDAASSSGAVAHMTPELRNQYANLFSFTAVLGELNRDAYSAMADFRTIEKHPRLTETSRDRLSRNLAQMRTYNNLLTVGARQWLETAKMLKLPFTEEDARSLRNIRLAGCRLPDATAQP